jgi:hypothetical protein
MSLAAGLSKSASVVCCLLSGAPLEDLLGQPDELPKDFPNRPLPRHHVIANTHAKVQIFQHARFPRPSQRKSQVVKMETNCVISPTLLYSMYRWAVRPWCLRSVLGSICSSITTMPEKTCSLSSSKGISCSHNHHVAKIEPFSLLPLGRP